MKWENGVNYCCTHAYTLELEPDIKIMGLIGVCAERELNWGNGVSGPVITVCMNGAHVLLRTMQKYFKLKEQA